MFLIGLLYLILEDVVLADFAWNVNSNTSRNKTHKTTQRTLTGIQVRQTHPWTLFLLLSQLSRGIL